MNLQLIRVLQFLCQFNLNTNINAPAYNTYNNSVITLPYQRVKMQKIEINIMLASDQNLRFDARKKQLPNRIIIYEIAAARFKNYIAQTCIYSGVAIESICFSHKMPSLTDAKLALFAILKE